MYLVVGKGFEPFRFSPSDRSPELIRLSRTPVLPTVGGVTGTRTQKPAFANRRISNPLQYHYGITPLNLAEAVRFELTDPFGSLVFKTNAINRALPRFLNFGRGAWNRTKNTGIKILCDTISPHPNKLHLIFKERICVL